MFGNGSSKILHVVGHRQNLRSCNEWKGYSHEDQQLFSLQWNLSSTDTFGTKIIVLISKVSLLQGENNIYLKNIKNVKGCRDGMPKSMQTRYRDDA